MPLSQCHGESTQYFTVKSEGIGGFFVDKEVDQVKNILPLIFDECFIINGCWGFVDCISMLMKF